MTTKGAKSNFTIPKAFKRATTDEQRVEIAYKSLGLDVIQKLDNLGKAKSVEISTKHRLTGNAQFAGKTPLHMHFALVMYSKSIAFAPYPKYPKDNSQELSFAFANRSAALFELGYYEECLEDIRHALEYNYPNHLRYKLLERRGCCESFMGRAVDGSKSLEEALGALSLAKLPEKRLTSLKSAISRRLKATNSSDGGCLRSKVIETTEAPPKSYGENPTIPCASDCVEIKYSEEFGRHMVATRDIYPGDVVVVEPPFAAAFIMATKENGCELANHSHCYTCMKRLPALLPCKFCPLAMFCSESCRQSSWDDYHRYECPIIVMLTDLPLEGNVFLLLRVFLRACKLNGGLVGLYEAVKAMEQDQSKDRIKGFNKDGRYDSSDYTTMYNLLTHTDKFPNTQLFMFAMQASILTRTLDTFTDFFSQPMASPPPLGGPPKDWKMFVGGVILRTLQSMTTSSCGVADFVEGPGDKPMLKIKYAHGLYPTSAMFNHSCNPNVLSHFRDGNVRGVMAVRSAKKGDQLFIALGKSYVIEELSKRRAFIQAQCFFTCRCEACTNDWPTPGPLDKAFPLIAPNGVWRCPHCETVLPPIPRSWRKPPEMFVHVCRSCGGSFGNGQLKEDLQDIAVQAHFVFMLMRHRSGVVPVDLRAQLAEQLVRIERLVDPPHPLSVAIQEHLHQNFAVLGNYYKL